MESPLSTKLGHHKKSNQETLQTNAIQVTATDPHSGDPTLHNSMQLKWGTFHCRKKKLGKRCDLCDHIIEKSKVESLYFKKPFAIHGHLAHDHVPEGKIRWFVYQIVDIPCNKEIIGSTTNPNLRWANYKSCCNRKKSNGTGLCKHFMEGCPNDKGDVHKKNLSFSLVDFYDTTNEKLKKAKHLPGPKCRCKECMKLKEIEDKWILKMGSFYGSSGLNIRDEIKKKSRGGS